MRISDFIIAEDIRNETGNKFSIMGIYNEEIILNQPEDVKWPIPFRFGIFIRIDMEDSTEAPNRFLFKIIRDEKLEAQVDGNIESIENAPTITIPLVLFPFPIFGDGKLQFCFEVFKEDNLLIEQTEEVEVISKKSSN
ncbi:hypothetical protein SAMN06296273_1188 [Nitrosomonas ureae]|uniref:Uncharacterized protein n=1 Tax=Nitrosomonas ureae TaxID=44577 RepID=A0A285BWT5_9PROT|nr:hypothetical protein [Nitrosomonas ureae]SNX59754.1 hypothetical protein SAMN06296273_1188 [Nitrosomonas ureae]